MPTYLLKYKTNGYLKYIETYKRKTGRFKSIVENLYLKCPYSFAFGNTL